MFYAYLSSAIRWRAVELAPALTASLVHIHGYSFGYLEELLLSKIILLRVYGTPKYCISTLHYNNTILLRVASRLHSLLLHRFRLLDLFLQASATLELLSGHQLRELRQALLQIRGGEGKIIGMRDLRFDLPRSIFLVRLIDLLNRSFEDPIRTRSIFLQSIFDPIQLAVRAKFKKTVTRCAHARVSQVCQPKIVFVVPWTGVLSAILCWQLGWLGRRVLWLV